MSQDVRDNILSPSQWLRILYMVIFAVVSWALGIVLTVLIVLQALFSLATGKDNENLRQLGGALSKYYYQILLYLTYKSDEKPFPFAPFPDTPGAAPLDPVAPAPEPAPASPTRPGTAPRAAASAAGHGHASTVTSPAPVASPDFVSEHEPDPVGSVLTEPASAHRGDDGDEDDVFAGISFTGPRGGSATTRGNADTGHTAPAAGSSAAEAPAAETAPLAEAASLEDADSPAELSPGADADSPVELTPGADAPSSVEAATPAGLDTGAVEEVAELETVDRAAAPLAESPPDDADAEQDGNTPNAPSESLPEEAPSLATDEGEDERMRGREGGG